MADSDAGTLGVSRVIGAEREVVYRTFLDPEALATWQAPEGMRAQVHSFDGRVGGGYEMSLFYPESERGTPGKTGEREDRYRATFVELDPPSRIVEAITFETDDPAMMGEMRMIVTLEERGGGSTNLTIRYEDLPPGISPEDNEAGTRSSLEKLARHVVGQESEGVG